MKTFTFRCSFSLILILSGCSMKNMSMQPWNNSSEPDIYSDTFQAGENWDKNNDTMSKPTTIVQLHNGDIYDMSVTKVMKEIWNSEIPMLAYNGSIPWPLIKVDKWATVTIRFTNKVTWLETLLHSHWVRVDNTMDGVAISMMWHQNPITYGETFEYVLHFPDEGVFWYHPHVQEELQQELWLYGNYLVEGTGNTGPYNRQEMLVMDDILLENGKVPDFLKNGTNYALMGRFWNIMLINGSSNYQLRLMSWEVVRLYITNVSNTRTYNLKMPWIRMKRVWWDIGFYEHEERINELTIAPAERYIIDIMADHSWNFNILNDNDKGKTVLWTVDVEDENTLTSFRNQFSTLADNPSVIQDISWYRSLISSPIQKTLSMSIEMWWMMKWWWMGMMQHASSQSIEREDDMYMMNKMSNSNTAKRKLIDKDTKKENMDIDWSFKKWDHIKIRVYNEKNNIHSMQHPFHMHGQRFLVVSHNGIENKNLVRKDTVLVPSWEYVDLILDASNPWTRMAHCHIAEHLSAGMMMTFKVQ